MMTGYDQVLPHFQSWTEYTTATSDTNRRFKLLVQVRRDVLDRTIRQAADRHQRRAAGYVPKFEINDLVICWLNSHEVAKLLKRFGTTKMMPRWSEPCRILRFKNKERTIAVVQSIWHEGLYREVSIGDILALPRTLHEETLSAAKYEMLGDLKRAAYTRDGIQPLQKRLSRIAGTERDQALKSIRRLEDAWPTIASDSEQLGPSTSTIQDEVVVEIDETPTPKPVRKKRRYINILGSWTPP